MKDHEILDAVAAGESLDWEFKSAKGGFPASVWETYSAMANTDGGTIVLGIGEADGAFFVEGLKNPQQALKTCWDTVNNRGKVSANLLASDAVRLVEIDGKQVLVIQVPRANRRQRPIFVGQNPLEGTFRRNYEGDYKCRADEVGRMLADQSPEAADSRVLPNFGIADLDAETIRQYRNRFSARNPNHAWLNEDTQGFLMKLGGWAKDRATGEEGLTVAGLLDVWKRRCSERPGNGLEVSPGLPGTPDERHRRPMDGSSDDRRNVDAQPVPVLSEGLSEADRRPEVAVRLPPYDNNNNTRPCSVAIFRSNTGRAVASP